MKWWMTANKEVPLHQQLETQIVLAILAGDLKAGEKLPSTRSLARRLAVHPNTVSSVYQKLQQQAWLVARPGSGMYVKDRSAEYPASQSLLDSSLSSFLSAMRGLGFSMAEVHARLSDRCRGFSDHLLLVEQNGRVAEIVLAELRALASTPIRWATPEDCRKDRGRLLGAVPLCRPTAKSIAQEIVGPDCDVLVLPINSALTSLAPLASDAKGRLIAVASHWSEFLETAQTMLVAAGVSPDALVIWLANEDRPASELCAVDAILCDTFTASTFSFPSGPARFVFPVLAPSARAVVKAAESVILSSQPAVALEKVS